jgi:parallel beta-helix repeat protein
MYGNNSGFNGTLNIYQLSVYAYFEETTPLSTIILHPLGNYGGSRYQPTAADGNFNGVCPDIYIYSRGTIPSNRMVDPNGFNPQSHWTCAGGGGTIYLRGGTIPPGSNNLNTTLVVEAENSSLNGAFYLYGNLAGNSTLSFHGTSPGIFKPNVSEFYGDLKFLALINTGAGSETYSFNDVNSVPRSTSRLFFDGTYKTGSTYPLYFYFNNGTDTNWTINNPVYIGEKVNFYVETSPYKANKLTLNNTLQIGLSDGAVVTTSPVFVSPLAFGTGAVIVLDVVNSSKYDNFTCSNETIGISLATLNITVNSSFMNSFNRRIIATNSNMTGQSFAAVNIEGNSTPASLIYYGGGINFTLEGLCPNGWSGTGVESDPCQITECNSINKPNFYYRLQNNISATGNCFIINASNITFDGQNNIIRSSNGFGTGMIFNNSNFSTFKNTNISNFVIDLAFYSSPDMLVTENIIENFSSIGVYNSFCDRAVISYNNISSTRANGIYGTRLENSLNMTILGNRVRSMQEGIDVQQNSNYARVLNNTVSDFVRRGIVFWNNQYGYIEGNNATNCSWDGITFLASNHSVIKNNQLTGNTNGVDFNSGTYNLTFEGNNIANNSDYGLKVEDHVDGMRFYWNNLSNNLDGGIAFLFGVVQTNLSIYNNLFNNSANIYVSAGGITSTSNSFNTSLSYSRNIINGRYIGGNFWTNSSATGFSDTCIDSAGDGICDLSYNLSKMSGGIIGFDYLPLSVPDFTAPSLTIIYPENASYTNNVSALNYTYSDLHTGFCWYSRNNGASNSSSVVAGINFSGVTSNEGTNNWGLYCVDGAENSNSTNITFFKDSAPPSITLSKSSSTTSSLIININAVDEGTGVASCSSSRGIISGITSVSDSGLECGTFYDYNVNCSDYMNFSDIGQISLSTDNCPGSSGGTVISDLSGAIDLSQGYDGKILLGEILQFNLGSQRHSIFLQILTQNSATFKISSESQIVTLKVGEEKYLDLSGSGVNDFYIKLNNVSYRRADITIKTLGSSVETPAGGAAQYIPLFSTERGDVASWLSFYLAIITLIVALILLVRIFFKKHKKHSKK